VRPAHGADNSVVLVVPNVKVRTEAQYYIPSLILVVLGGLVVSVIATGPKVRGFDPGRGRSKGDKNP
jgi:hypothetical protein